MRGAIMQPTYLPWLGYFAMIDNVDLFVFLDDVQLTKRSWQVRNRIKGIDGKEIMLSIPLHTKGRDNTMICDASFADSDWYKRHMSIIKQNYSKAPYYDEIMILLQTVYEKHFLFLSDLNIELISSICKYLGITTPLYKSSDICGKNGKKDDLLVDICNKMKINSYLSAKGSSVYIEKNNKGGAFANASIRLEYQNYEHPIYNQLGVNFVPYMGVIDLLFNEGRNSLCIIRSGIRTSYNSDNVFDENNGY